MEAKVLIVCLFVSLSMCHINGQVGSLCRPKERLLQCGCPATCRDPVPNCEGVCKEGCFCEEGQVRNDDGQCVKLADCPPMGICPENEEYRFCEPCNRTCTSPNPICPAQCAKGCFCKGDLLRDSDGRCVQWGQCSNVLAKNRQKEDASEPHADEGICPENEEFRFCEPCNRTCASPNPICPAQCAKGCFCKGDLLRDSDGRCVQSCGDLAPVCGSECRTGCFCKEGLVKGPGGRCIKEDKCPGS
ncbi:Zonadhesin [Operophtera brumata]|uniref:Zonadhesin n=1 Tax=Operophtera brumata TaxID=104452 RepID=A0A0L7LIN3_OPEBR|nr:Zonadhesin [Operophtera brumata]